jgi:hypothetical protein
VTTVFIPVALRKFSSGRESVELDGEGSLRQVFERLERECPGIRSQLIFDNEIHPGLAIFVNDEQTSQGLIERVPADASVRIQPAIAGGGA